MKLFLKNIFRTILKNKGSYIGGILVIALGVLIFVSMSNVVTNVQRFTDSYYNEYNFGEVFAKVGAIPENELKKLESIEGIKNTGGRLSTDARLILDGSENIITLHIMSYDKDNDNLNKFMVSEDLTTLTDDNILIGSKMFEANKFNIDDKLNIIINEEIEVFTIAETVQSPEHILTVTASGTLDSEVYDIACVSKAKLEKLLNKKNVINELSFTLKSGYKFSDIKYELEEKLKPYGLISLVERKDQLSNNFLQTNIMTFSNIATSLPIIFLIVSIFMLYIILKKMIDQDRSLIGTIKAFGFKDSEIIISYMKQGIITGIIGGVVGDFLSIPLGKYVFNMFTSVYNIPNTGFKFYISNAIIGIFLSVITSILATYFGVKEILKINPAESMRSLAPVFNTKFVLPKILNKILNSRKRMGSRAIFRNKFRSLVMAISIAFPFGLTAALSSAISVQESMLLDQFNKVQTYDLKVNLYNHVNYNDAIDSIKNLDGAYNVEAMAEYVMTLKYNNRTENSNIIGLNKGSKLYKIMDDKYKFYEPLEDGLIINSVIARKLNIKSGDIIELENSSLSVQPIKIQVIKVINELLSSSCYININSINKYFNINKTANSIMFNIDKEKLKDIKTLLINTKNISDVQDKYRNIKSNEINLQSTSSMMIIFEILSVIAGIVLIYNILNINIRERRNEFGTMSILGLTFNEISEIIIFEQTVNLILGLIAGFPISIMCGKMVEAVVSNDSFSMNLSISSISYLYSFIICLFIVILSLIAVLHNVKNIELTDVLKERE